ncbi:MAG: hypothetical protein LLF75_08255 [Eubacteriales bacterium]|nr:hypothetical protein [Eubacteriales bacterium]
MEKLPVNPNCELSGTKYCQTLNMHACATCTVRDSDHKADIKNDLDLYETLLPEGGVARLFQSRECQFCKTTPKGVRKGYAILDMAHPEPRRVQKWLFGKRTARIGTMIPLQMSVCRKCRSRLLSLEYLPMVIPVAVGIAALFVFSADAVKGPLVDLSMFAPFAGWLVSVLFGALIGRLIANGLGKSWEKDMYVDVMQHPAVAEMTEKGWMPITAKSRTKLLFSKSRLARGLGTAEDPNSNE